MAGYPPGSQPPAYDDHDFDSDDSDLDDNQVFENEGFEEPVQRRYKKKEDKKSYGRERTSSASSVRVQLNRLSQKEVDDGKMASVFGNDDEKEARRNSMRVNPLYDQDGSVTVSSTEAQRAQGSSTSNGAEETNGKKSKRTFKKSKSRDNDDETENAAQEPKIGYSQNFRFKGPAKQNGTANGQGPKKTTTKGRIMPSRISRNAIPGSQIMASLSGKERPKQVPDQPVETPLSYSDEVEASQRRSEIRKKWRLVVALILIILVFALILVVVLYFAAKGS